MTNRELANLILNTKKDLLVPVLGSNDTFYVKAVKSDFARQLMSNPDAETEWSLDRSFKNEMYLDTI